jgi:hypothetical protein
MKFKFRKSERGQALAEYMPLIPPVLLLSVLILIPVAERTGDIYCRMVNAMDPTVCEVEEVGEEVVVDECVVFEYTEGGSQCDQDDNCTKTPGQNSGLYVDKGGKNIKTFVIKAGTEYRIYETGETDDQCYFVIIDGNAVTWSKTGKGKNCKDVSHGEVWRKSFCK